MIKLFKKNTLKWSLLGIGLLVLIGGMALTNARGDTRDQSVEQDPLLLKQMVSEVKPSTDQQGTEADGDEGAVAKLVDDFGRNLQTVSPQAPKDIVNKSMQENYGDFVSPALLAKWQNDPKNAPGRAVSSPWPDRIDYIRVNPVAAEAYEVKGEIIEISSVEKVSGGVAARRPITLVVKKIENRWLIDAVTLGTYEPYSIVYKNTQYGFNFFLPASWQGYTLVTEKWEGYTPGGPQGYQIGETGPMISIRHPQWTAQNPRQDIPILVFTLAQWNSLQQGKFYIGAAFGPNELGRNTKYVFALPARYNYTFPTGFEEVEKILATNPLRGAVEDQSNKQLLEVELHLYNESSKKVQPELGNVFFTASDLDKFERLFESLEPSKKLAVDKVQKIAMLAAHGGKNGKVEKREDYLLIKLNDGNLYMKKIIYSGTDYDFEKYSKEKNADILKKAGLGDWSEVESSQLPFSM